MLVEYLYFYRIFKRIKCLLGGPVGFYAFNYIISNWKLLILCFKRSEIGRVTWT